MAKLVGGISTSHIPAIGRAIATKQQNDPYWKRFFDGYVPVREWLNKVKPDLVILVYNDHGLNFFLDTVPTFALGAATSYETADEGWGLKTQAHVDGDAPFSWHLIENLVQDEFDITICQEMLVDHGFVVPMTLLFGEKDHWPIKAIPLTVNTVQHPVPSAKRCYKLGQALGNAIASYPDNMKVVIVGTGGMSHQLQGERAGIINVDFDLECIENIIHNPEWLTRISNSEIMRRAGTEGIETIMWMVMRGALGEKVKLLHKHYHAPISNTGAGVLLLEPADS
jgi:protocatechuate 4,5-dioxygenase, beta chain